MLALVLGGLLIGGGPALPALAVQTVCTAELRSRMAPGSGPPGTHVRLSWNFGAPGPLITVSWDGQALLNGVPQPNIDDCFRGVEIVVPAGATPGPHAVNVDCAFCLVAFSYGTFTFTVTGATATATAPAATPTVTRTGTPAATATPTAARPTDSPQPTATPPQVPGPPRTGKGSMGSHESVDSGWRLGSLALGSACLLLGATMGLYSRTKRS